MGFVRVEPSGCWTWIGCMDGSTYNNTRNPRGRYGRFAIVGARENRRSVAAHRASYMLFVGEIPAGKYVCHKCDDPGCVNHEHLFLGTAKQNMDDMWAKGRAAHQQPGYVSPRAGTGLGRGVPGRKGTFVDASCTICFSDMLQGISEFKEAKRPVCSPKCKGTLNSLLMRGVLH